MDKLKIQIPNEFKELYNDQWRYLAIEGGRNSGKSFNAGLCELLRGRMTKKRILCTREIQNTIKDSVHKVLADQIHKYVFNDYHITNDSIVNLVTGSEFIFKGLRMNTNEIKSMEGIDDCWVEEAQSITKQSLDILIPTIRKSGSRILFTYNRFTELDPVHTRFVLNAPPKTYHAHINYDTMEKYGLLTDEIKAEIEFDRINNPENYAHIWLGEPISQSDQAVINRKDIMEAMSRTIEDDGQIELGVDVARMGDDRTVLWKRKGLKTLGYRSYTKKRTTDIVALIEDFIDQDKTVQIKVDDTGVGGGVTDGLISLGYNVVAVNFGATPMDKNRYPNKISEMWFNFRDILGQIELPEDQDLLMELSTRQWKQDIKGKRCIEGKLEYKKRGYRSPDIADSVVLCYYQPSAGGWTDYIKAEAEKSQW